MTRRLLLEEGLFVGVSCGAAVCGAIRYAKKLKTPKRLVVLLPDSGNRYMSKVFDDDWMRENGFLEDGLGSVRELLAVVRGDTKSAIISAKSEDQVEKIIHLMREKGISQIPVMKGKEIEGLVSETNLLNALFTGKIHRSDRIGSIVEQNFVRVSLNDDVERLTQSIAGGQIPIAVENGEITAIITKIDLITFMGQRK